MYQLCSIARDRARRLHTTRESIDERILITEVSNRKNPFELFYTVLATIVYDYDENSH